MKKLLALSILPLALLQCKSSTSEEEQPIARVYDKYLYNSDVEQVLPDNYAKSDSVKIVDKYVEDWVKEQTIVYNAEFNLSTEQQNFEKQLTNYKNSLLKYTYETELIIQRLDTSVSDEEILNYYELNSESFKLKDYALRASFVKLSSDLNNLSLAESLFRSSRPEDQLDLEDFCTQYATASFFDEGNSWVYLHQLLKEVPLDVTSRPDRFFRYNKFIKHTQDNFVYLVQIHEYLNAGELAPLPIERERIKNSIINKRKTDLLAKIRYDLYAKAKNNKEIEIY